ncbi:CBO0543 family protein [Bacillus sp. FJAT-45350]|uniref:CBO0543 family protein n=1 Tax=Bacillus sp. FJAT-45350 TaxID=2011014 RepID=UPI000BB8D0F9
MIERLILLFGIIFGIVSYPSLFKKPSSTIWIPLYIGNCLINYFFDKALVKFKKVKYPIRFLPKIFRINVVYDFLVCPFLSVWFCQSTYNSKTSGTLGKLLLFAIPQGIYEIILERKTKALKFKRNWRWVYSLYLVFIVKIISRVMLMVIKRFYKKKSSHTSNNSN